MLPADNEYFRRCVERFRALLRGGSGEGGTAAAAGSGRTLFVLCELENRCVAPPPCQVRHANTSCVLQHMHLSSSAMPALASPPAGKVVHSALSDADICASSY